MSNVDYAAQLRAMQADRDRKLTQEIEREVAKKNLDAEEAALLKELADRGIPDAVTLKQLVARMEEKIQAAIAEYQQVLSSVSAPAGASDSVTTMESIMGGSR